LERHARAGRTVQRALAAVGQQAGHAVRDRGAVTPACGIRGRWAAPRRCGRVGCAGCAIDEVGACGAGGDVLGTGRAVDQVGSGWAGRRNSHARVLACLTGAGRAHGGWVLGAGALACWVGSGRTHDGWVLDAGGAVADPMGARRARIRCTRRSVADGMRARWARAAAGATAFAAEVLGVRGAGDGATGAVAGHAIGVGWTRVHSTVDSVVDGMGSWPAGGTSARPIPVTG